MSNNILYLTISILLLIIAYNCLDNRLEHYDTIVQGVTFDNCGKKCKETNDCFAFSYSNTDSNTDTNKCYLAKNTIKRDYTYYTDFKHSDEYNENHILCNKYIPITNFYENKTSPNKYPSFHERRSNSFYTCSYKNEPNKTFLHNEDKMIKIEEGQNFDYIEDIDIYQINDIEWT